MWRGFNHRSRWFTRPLKHPDAATVLCLAPPSHGPASFSRWPGAVDGIQFAPLRFPGDWDARWWHDHETVQAQADDLITELRLLPHLRFAFFAHGSSALIAYETAVRLCRLERPIPRRLIISGYPVTRDTCQDGPEPSDEHSMEALRIFSELRVNPLPSLLEISLRGLRAEAIAVRRYVAENWQRLGIPITSVMWRQEARSLQTMILPWQDCGPVTSVELDGTSFSYAQAPSALMRILTAEGTVGDGN